VVFFADDKVMMQLESWFSMNNMVINSVETKAMIFPLNKIQDCIEPDITFKKVKINYTSQFRFLGIDITNKLKWNIHIQSVCKKLSKMCYIIKALKDEVCPHILRNVYFAKVQTQISYGLIFWKGESESNRILMLQKRVLHIIKGVTKRT
jgi:hypothetical protein